MVLGHEPAIPIKADYPNTGHFRAKGGVRQDVTSDVMCFDRMGIDEAGRRGAAVQVNDTERIEGRAHFIEDAHEGRMIDHRGFAVAGLDQVGQLNVLCKRLEIAGHIGFSRHFQKLARDRLRGRLGISQKWKGQT